MNRPFSAESPIEAKSLTAELDAIAAEHGGASAKARRAVLELLKEVLANGRALIRARLEQDGHGTLCAERLSALVDDIVTGLFDFASRHVFPASNPSAAERLSLVAVGGYGRGTLAPASDIDLLFLFPYKKTPWSESVTEYILYMLWDLRLKVGHATRTVNETLKTAREDTTVRTAVLEARHLCGDAALFAELQKRFDKEVVAGTAREFIAAKLAERDSRHARVGASRYLVEPNVKEGKGGQRDLQTLFWIAKYYYRVGSNEALVDAGLLEPGGIPAVPPLRRFPVGGALPPALLGGAGGGAHLLRLAAGAGAPARLPETPGPGSGRALDEALFPGRQGRRRPDPHRLRRAGAPRGEEHAAAEPPAARLHHACRRSSRARAISSSSTAASTSPTPWCSSATR